MTETRVSRTTLVVLALCTAMYFMRRSEGHADSWMFYMDCFMVVWALINAGIIAAEGVKK